MRIFNNFDGYYFRNMSVKSHQVCRLIVFSCFLFCFLFCFFLIVVNVDFYTMSTAAATTSAQTNQRNGARETFFFMLIVSRHLRPVGTDLLHFQAASFCARTSDAATVCQIRVPR